MDPPEAGNYNIQTNDERFLSLANPGDPITLVNGVANNNQVWDLQIDRGNYTFRNVGQDAFARSNIAANVQVTGGVAAMNWILIADGAGFSIRPAGNNNFRWNVNGDAVNLLGIVGALAIENAHRFNILQV